MDVSKSAIKIFLSRIGNTVLGFVGITIFARELGPNEMGVFFLFQAALGLMTIPVDLGVRGAVEKRISEGMDGGDIVATAGVTKIVLLIVASLIILLFREALDSYLGSELTLLLIVILATQEAALLTGNVIKGELRVGKMAEFQLIRQFAWVAPGVVLVKILPDAISLIYALWIAFLMVLIWGIRKANVGWGTPRWSHFWSIYEYAKYNVIVSSLGGKLYQWLDIAIMGFILSNALVGAYEIAWRVSLLVMLFSYSLATTILPQISKWDADGQYERISDLLSRTMLPTVALVIPGFFGGLALSGEILSVIFGTEYAIASTALVVLLGAKVVESIYVILERSLQALNRPNLSARAMVVSLVLNAVLNVVLILEFGIVGAAFATLGSTILNTALHIKYLNQFVSIEFPTWDVGWCLLSSLVMYFLVMALDELVKAETLPSLLLVIVVGAIAYLALIMLNRNIRFELMSQARLLIPQ